MLRGFMEPTRSIPSDKNQQIMLVYCSCFRDDSAGRGKKVIMLWTSFDYCREYLEYNKQADELMRGFVIKKKSVQWSIDHQRQPETMKLWQMILFSWESLEAFSVFWRFVPDLLWASNILKQVTTHTCTYHCFVRLSYFCWTLTVVSHLSLGVCGCALIGPCLIRVEIHTLVHSLFVFLSMGMSM